MIEKISEEERILLEQLGLIKKKKTPAVATEFKLIMGTSTCKLCGTVTTQLIKMMKVNDCWIKKEEIPLEQIDPALPYEEYETEVRMCWNCRNVFMEKSKEELVEIIINLFNPVMERQEIWKTVKKMKGEKHE
jgi:hypothetical protein